MNEEALFGVEVRHLSALTAVARERSFRGAADSLGYVQSAVSQQVADLERLVGVRLVERSRGRQKVCLTDVGELLVAHAEEILARLGAARADLVSRSDGPRARTLKVGVFQSVATRLLPEIIQRLEPTEPMLEVVPVEVTRDAALFDPVERGLVDMAFGDLPLGPGSFESCTILSDPCMLLVAADSDLAERPRPPSLEELAGQRLIALEGWRYLGGLEAWFTAHGLELSFAFRVAQEATIRALVASGAGSAIVPRLALAHDPGTSVVDLSGVVPSRKLALYWPRDRRELDAVEAFRQVALATASDLYEPDRSRAPGKPVLVAA